MPLNDPQGTANPEVITGSPEQQLREWRQIAIAEGIPPAQIDEYLLDRDDVPDDVKQYIREEMAKAAPTPERVAPVAPGVQPEVQPVEEVAKKVVEKPKIADEVSIIGAKEKIAEIRKQYIEGEQPEEAGMEVPGTPEKADVIAQTAEQKEQTTTMGTQDTAGGVAARMSLGAFGYQPSQQIAADAQQIAAHGDVRAGKTWQALLLQRFVEIWGSFRGLFSS